jgi:hypothetical protein
VVPGLGPGERDCSLSPGCCIARMLLSRRAGTAVCDAGSH